MIVENDYDIGNYKNDLKDIETKAVRAKVGILNMLDIKLEYVNNGNNNLMYLKNI